MATKITAIKAFLLEETHKDLAELYFDDGSMQCTVYVDRENGERIEGVHEGHSWTGYTDGVNIWKNFSIPWNARSSADYDVSSQMTFDLSRYALGIGLSGWNWKTRTSHYVGFDFDSIIGHKKGLTDKDLSEIIDKVSSVPWVTVRKSTSGKGLHLYCFIDCAGLRVENSLEHAAVAKSVLNLLTSTIGYDFTSKVDKFGSNFWVWHRKMLDTDGLSLIKAGSELVTVGMLGNWKDYIGVGRPVRAWTPMELESETLEDLIAKKVKTPLNSEHLKLINWLRERGYYSEWRSEDWILITHTSYLKEAHKALALRGWFDTIAMGKEGRDDKNCFASPLPRGTWSVRRYSPGCTEINGWLTDSSGWTYTYFNRDPDLHVAARINEGVEHKNGGYVFQTVDSGMQAVSLLGGDLGRLPNWILGREMNVKEHSRDINRIIVEVKKAEGDSGLTGWIAERGKWSKVINIKTTPPRETEGGERYDDKIRHLVGIDGSDAGWVIRSDEEWRDEPLQHVKPALKSLGYMAKEIEVIIGSCVFRPWKIVYKPFEDVGESNREWNRYAPQYRYSVTDYSGVKSPTWDSILRHIGQGIDSDVIENKWCKMHNIETGIDYLKYWLASVLKAPRTPLPYLFLFGEQGSGKSILPQSINLLITGGCEIANDALLSQGGFNGELEGAIVCVVEEIDLKGNKGAYNRLKDWVTSPEISIHKKGATPYKAENMMHFIHCSNHLNSVPIFSGDRRITIIKVEPLGEHEKKSRERMRQSLRKEAPDFLTELLHIELFEPEDDMNLPALMTSEKISAEGLSRNTFEIFLSEEYAYCPGGVMLLSELYDAFLMWLEPSERNGWSKIKIGKSLPSCFIKGRRSSDSQHCIANIAKKGKESLVERKEKWVLKGEMLK